LAYGFLFFVIFISGLVQPEGGEQGLPPPVGLFLSAEQKAGPEEPEEAHGKRLQGNKILPFCTLLYSRLQRLKLFFLGK